MTRPDAGFARLVATGAALTLACLPHVTHFPPWVSALLPAALAWRLAAEQRGWALPPAWLRAALALAATLGVLGTYRTLNGLDAGTALLAVMAALKVTETRAPRDHAVLVFIGYFLCLATLLYGEQFWRLAYALGCAWLLTAALARVHRPVEANTPVRPFRLATRMLALGLPLAAVLFVFVPRIEGRFWAIPEHAQAHVSGIDDTMSPGDVAELTLSEEPVFRVWFEGPVPRPAARYFRMLVLEDFDGRGWHRAADERVLPATRVPAGAAVGYRIALEPTQREWLPALETLLDPDDAEPGVARRRADQLVHVDRESGERRPVTRPFDYRLRADPAAPGSAEALPGELAPRELALPPGVAPRARALALELRRAAGSDVAYVAAVLARFHDDRYSYTLSPPPAGVEPVDAFLFDTRAGFCEHYASAFTVLMRAAGVPARVVVGYQGGEFNRYGGYLLVRQSRAHAWSEVWIAGRGWRRVDPTAAVAPERIESGTAARAAEAGLAGLYADLPWLENLRAAWDATRTAWARQVVGFNPELQRRLLEVLGLASLGLPGLALALGVGFVLAALGLGSVLAVAARPRRRDPVAVAWDAFGRALAARELGRGAAEGPLDYGRRIAPWLPGHGAEVEALAAEYARLRYLALPTAAERAAFVARARRLARACRR